MSAAVDRVTVWADASEGKVQPARFKVCGRFDLAVATDVHAAAAEWTAFSKIAPCSPYQRYEWVSAWFNTLGDTAGLQPVIAILRNLDGETLAILPLAKSKQGLAWHGTWLGDKHTNYFVGLFSPDVNWGEIDWPTLMTTIGHAAGIDVFVLQNQLDRWEGMDNPLLTLPHFMAPDSALHAELHADFDSYRARLPKGRWRRQLRRKREKLNAEKPISIVRASTTEDARRLLDAFFEQRAQRMVTQGIPDPYRTEPVRAFFRSLAAHTDFSVDRERLLDIYALEAGGEVLAIFGGSAFRGRFATSLASMSDGPLAQYSPGELLLEDLTRDRCAIGDSAFDLGTGEARYKKHWCPETSPLYDIIHPVTPLGRISAELMAGRQALKRWIKTTPSVWKVALKLRRSFTILRG